MLKRILGRKNRIIQHSFIKTENQEINKTKLDKKSEDNITYVDECNINEKTIIIPETEKILLMGNSHVYIMLGEERDNTQISDFIYQNKEYKNITMFRCEASTAMGFRPNHNSKTQAFSKFYEYIKTIDPTTKIVINMGQVDLDIIYLNRCIKQEKNIDIEEFIYLVLNNYLQGILEIRKIIPNICVFGINPPSMLTIRSILTIASQTEKIDDYKSLPYDFLIETRTENSRIFNMKLKEMALSNGFRYVDAWDRLYDGSGSNTKIIHRKYLHPECDDHHIYTQSDNEWMSYFIKKLKDA